MSRQLKSKDVQKAFDITRQDVHCLVRIGVLTPLKVKSNKFYYSLEEVNEFINFLNR